MKLTLIHCPLTNVLHIPPEAILHQGRWCIECNETEFGEYTQALQHAIQCFKACSVKGHIVCVSNWQLQLALLHKRRNVSGQTVRDDLLLYSYSSQM